MTPSSSGWNSKKELLNDGSSILCLLRSPGLAKHAIDSEEPHQEETYNYHNNIILRSFKYQVTVFSWSLQ